MKAQTAIRGCRDESDRHALLERSDRRARYDFLAISALFYASVCNIAYFLIFSLA